MNNLEMLQNMSLEEMTDFLSQFDEVINMATDSYCSYCILSHDNKCLNPEGKLECGFNDDMKSYVKWWLQQSNGYHIIMNKK